MYYGWRAVKLKPLSLAGWRLLFVALFKALPNTKERVL